MSKGRDGMRMRCRHGFTLVELLVVTAIISILAAMLLPVLKKARDAALRTVCISNLKQVALAGMSYANEFGGFRGHAQYPGIYTSSDVPSYLSDIGFTNRRTCHPDHYLGLGYIELGTTYQGNKGNDVFMCPAARASLGRIYRLYRGNWGNTECHFFFSELINDSREDYDRNRDNHYGSYRENEIKVPSDTFISGDAMGFTDSVYADTDAVMGASFVHGNVGERSTCFGAHVVWGSSYLDAPLYTHERPNGLYWDGHAATVNPPPPVPAHRDDMKIHFTANHEEN